MKKRFSFNGKKIVMVAAAASLALGAPLHASATTTINKLTGYTAMGKINPTTVELKTKAGVRTTLDFYGENIVRIFRDNAGGIIRDPKATPDAKILVANPRKPVSKLEIKENGNNYIVTSCNKFNCYMAADIAGAT